MRLAIFSLPAHTAATKRACATGTRRDIRRDIRRDELLWSSSSLRWRALLSSFDHSAVSFSERCILRFSYLRDAPEIIAEIIAGIIAEIFVEIIAGIVAHPARRMTKKARSSASAES